MLHSIAVGIVHFPATLSRLSIDSGGSLAHPYVRSVPLSDQRLVVTRLSRILPNLQEVLLEDSVCTWRREAGIEIGASASWKEPQPLAEEMEFWM